MKTFILTFLLITSVYGNSNLRYKSWKWTVTVELHFTDESTKETSLEHLNETGTTFPGRIAYCILFHTAFRRQGFGPTEQEWGFVTVREGAHMFWWLHQTTADVEDYTERPLIIWLQGGPGSSSTGFGNFAELGPLDESLNPRNTSWTNYYNVLFVDNPVGTGFSYVDDVKDLTTTNAQIAKDFVVLLQGFYEAVPALKTTPLYIFSESYGGKMTAEIALEVDKAVKQGVLDINLVGVGLGDSWISPIDSVLTWGPYLYNVGALDQNGLELLQFAASATKQAIDGGYYITATRLWGLTGVIASVLTEDIDFYNILTKIPLNELKRTPSQLKGLAKRDAVDYSITEIMAKVKEALGLEVEFETQADLVILALYADFMKPVTDVVELLLNTTDIRVGIYNGQLDVIVDTVGTLQWVDQLKFEGASEWKTANRKPIAVDNILEGYYKKVGNLAFYWVNRAGHMVPADNPGAMHFILEDVINGQWKN